MSMSVCASVEADEHPWQIMEDVQLTACGGASAARLQQGLFSCSNIIRRRHRQRPAWLAVTGQPLRITVHGGSSACESECVKAAASWGLLFLAFSSVR
jgi:hypothetical protein